MEFASESKLIYRLKRATEKGQRISFLLGAGLTCSKSSKDSMEPGVLNPTEIYDLIKLNLAKFGGQTYLEEELQNFPVTNKYQSAMKVLLECEGQDELNKVIATAVLNARRNRPSTLLTNQVDLAEIEKDTGNWHLRPGIDSLGYLLTNFSHYFPEPILTTNFDPLIEVSINRHNGTPQSIFLPNDGTFDNQHSQNIQQVIHLHGYWHGSDTLHTVEQITKERPNLKGCLRRFLSNTLLVVIGYGGWQDMFTKTFLEVISEGGHNINVLWTFFSDSESDILKDNKHLVEKLKNDSGRVIFYKGVDADTFFPNLKKELSSQSEEVKEILSNHGLAIIEPLVQEVNKEEGFFTCDSLPNNTYWTGRKKELEELRSAYYKIAFITGIGGQGKSGLASHYVKKLKESNESWEYYDWRDCKEEADRIHTKIVSIIERLSKGKIRASHLKDETVESLIDILINNLTGRRVVFVFDNIDHYIDLQNFSPVGAIKILCDKILKENLTCKFIFTCRPAVSVVDQRVLNLPLGGLTVDETRQLFDTYKLSIKQDEVAKLVSFSHQLTSGHPLWLSLIAAQAVRGKDIAFGFIEAIQNSLNPQTSTLADTTLKTIWNTLNEKQKILLRGMAEIVKAENENNIQTILNSELNANQFFKALRTLKSLNLIVIKSSIGTSDELELHPLVKQFIKNKYAKNERSKFITLLVEYYNQVIIILKPKLGYDAPLHIFETWTSKAELLVEKEEYQNALTALWEIYHPILAAGHSQEFIRVARKLFHNINWKVAITEEYHYFHLLLNGYIRSMLYFGEFEEVIECLEKYEMYIPGKSAHYIQLCSMRCYLFWFTGDYNSAIAWGENGEELALVSNNPSQDLSHNLALAYRDSKKTIHIEKALQYFLKEEKLEDLLDGIYNDEIISGDDYGNIGRCLHFSKRYDDAISCYLRSYNLLAAELNRLDQIINLGYASCWIAELSADTSDNLNSYLFYRFAISHWKDSAPYKVETIRDNLDLVGKDIPEDIKSYSDMQISRLCKKWIKDRSAILGVI